ncbi:MAG: sigma-70 family RNA polymerase sigma factor [Acidobacteria bacterium]|nr:sigma-70 family RNA polymerase sigma factor [Acidobacteriota bacterium]
MDEKEVIERVKAGDSAAARELFREYGERLLKNAYFLCSHPEDAEDIVQETFLVALRKIRQFRGDSSFYTYLYAIFRNTKYSYYRKKGKLQVMEDSLLNIAISGLKNNDEIDFKLIDSAKQKELGAALKRLTPEEREVIVLRFYENMKINDISRAMGLPTGTVKSKLYYALKKLRSEIKEV